MSIGSVQPLGPENGNQPADANLRAPRSQPAAHPVAIDLRQLDSGTESNQEIQHTRNVAAAAQQPEDVVQVQHDSEIADQVIIKYMVESTGRVILQVPSDQVLNVAHGISQDLRREAALQNASSPGTAEGEKYGH